VSPRGGWDGPLFGIGLNVSKTEFRHSDVNGRPIDPSTETETARSERIRALQERWVPREIPSAEPADVLREWMAASAANRTSAFALAVAEHPERIPVAELEPGPGQQPRPGGLIERMAAQRAGRLDSAIQGRYASGDAG
jgi:hypothetical protein